MPTLKDVQTEVNRQLIRDYGHLDFTSENITNIKANVFLGLSEEAGEVAGLMKRVLRNFPRDRARITQENFIEEMGDVLWYLAACCAAQGTTLEEIWEYNVKKLTERYGE